MTDTGPPPSQQRPGGEATPDHADGGPAYPTISQALWLLLGAILLQGLFQLAVELAGGAVGVSPGEHPGGLALVNVLAFGTVIAVAWKRSGASADSVFRLRPFRPSLVPAMSALILGAGIVFSEVDNAVRSVFPMPEELAEIMAGVVGPDASLWGSFFLLVLVAPFTEELLFRGVLLRGFEANYSKWVAIVACGLLFGFIHLNPWQFIATSAAGMVLAWWTLETGSIWPALYGHALNNTVPFGIDRVPGLEIPGFTGGMTGPVEFQPLWFDALGAVLAGWGLAYLVRAFAADDRASGQPMATGASAGD